jgi:hypothetical protein
LSSGNIDRKFWDHSKVKKAGLAAIGLWTICNAYCRDHRTSGFVSYETAAMFNQSGVQATKLVEVRLWIPVPGGYQFNKWQKWNPGDVPKGAVGDLIDKVIPRTHPQVTRGALEKQAAQLLDEGTDIETLQSALSKWLTKPNAGPSLLPLLVSDVLRERAEDDLGTLLAEAHKSGDISKLARRGMIYTPSDDEPDGLDVAGLRAYNLAQKRLWIETKQKELKS